MCPSLRGDARDARCAEDVTLDFKAPGCGICFVFFSQSPGSRLWNGRDLWDAGDAY